MKYPHGFYVWIVVLVLLAPTLAAAQDHNAAVAQQRYSRGVTFYEAGHYAEALEEFRASEATFASPNSRLFIARTLAQLGDDAAAVAAYELVIPLADDRGQTDVRYLETRRAAQNELQAIEPRVGRLTLQVPNAPPGVIVRVGAQQIPRDGLGVPLAFAPGTLHVRVEAPQFRAEERDVVLTAGARQDLAIALAPLPVSPVLPTASSGAPPRPRPVVHRPPWRAAALASGGVAVAGLAAFGALVYVTNQSYEALRAQCGGGPCPASDAPAVDRGRTLQVLTDVSLGVGIAGLVGAAVFFALGPRAERATPGVHVAVTANSIAIDGRF